MKVKYLMFDGTVKTELAPEDQINCEAILIHAFFSTYKEKLTFEKRWERKRDNILPRYTSLNNFRGLLP